VCVIHPCSVFLDACYVLFLFCLSTRVCVCLQVQGPGVLRPGASGLPYYCTPPVTISAVLGVSAVKQAKEPKKKTGVLRIVGVFPLARSWWNPGTGTIPQYQFKKPKQHTVTHPCCVFTYVCFILFLCCLFTCVCVCFKFKVHCGSALGPGASGLSYYCTPPVTIPDVIGGLAVWRHNNKNKTTKHVVYWDLPRTS